MAINGHSCTVFNEAAPRVLVLFHGYPNDASDYYPLASRFAGLNYAVVLPRDCEGPESLACAFTWGTDVSNAVVAWSGERPVGVVGHSMGGGAAMAAAKYSYGVSAFIAMHPAPIFSALSTGKVRGPILFTTGTYDDGNLGATTPERALVSYNDADEPKALVNVKGNVHMSSLTASGDEWLAVTSWLSCFVQHVPQSCEWVRTEMCRSPMLEWCYHYGIQTAMVTVQQSLHV